MPRGMRRKEERRPPPPPPMAASGMAGPCCSGCYCEVCGSGAATVFCHNDRAFLCDACDAEVHLRNPLAARHEVVSVSDQVIRDDRGVKVEAPPGLDAMQQASLALGQAELSRSSSTSDHTALKGASDEGLFDALDDFSVLELFTVGNFDHTCLDDFQQTELDQEWIEGIEKECPQPVAPLTETPPRAPLATPPTTTPAAASTSATINEPRMRGQVEQPLLSQAGGLQCQAWNRSYDAIAGLPLATTPPGPPSLLPFLATSLCPPMVPLMPQSLPSYQPLQDSLDRKARVARYREKRKHRKFENKIRYATRKLYAESRPRIKGRFARPDELEAYLKEKEAKAQ